MSTTVRRSRPVKTLIALSASAALWLIWSASASAATFCVHSNVACNGTPAATLGSALQSAKLNGAGRDTIQLPAGTFADAPVIDEVGNPVDIVGAGPDATIITSASSSSAVNMQEPTSTMSQLQVRATNTTGYTGINLNGTIDHVKVTGVATVNGAVGVYVDVSHTATIKHSSIDLDYGPTAETIGVEAATWSNLAVSDSSISTSKGVYLQESTADIERSRIWAEQGVEALTGAYGFVRNSSIRTPGRLPHNGPEYAFRARGSYDNEIDVISSTAYGDGDAGSVGASLQPLSNATSVISLTESAVAHYAKAADIDSSAGISSLYTAWSAYEFARITGNGMHAHAHDIDLTGVDPGFVDAAAGDFRLRFNSPLVDVGDPVALTSGDSDRDGNARIRDGGSGSPRLDIGATEYQHSAPTLSAGAAPGAADVGQAVSFSANASDTDPGEAVAVTWSFDDGTSAAGASVDHAFATAGAHTATARAIDASGLTTTATATVMVNAPAVAPGTPAPGHAAAPAIRHLRLLPAALRARSGSKLSFDLSQPAAVTVTVERPKGRKWVRVGSYTVSRSAGAAKLRFTARLGKTRLHAGNYRVRLVARNTSGMRSQPVLAKFRIVRGG